jgi:SH3-like domain-containing protein
MRFRVVHGATRILLAFSIVMAAGVMAAGRAGAAATDSIDTQQIQHPVKPDAHRMREQHGKAHVGRAVGEKVPADKGRADKGQTAKAPGADQKGHGAVPAAVVAPPAPKPPAQPAAKETTEPPPKIPRFAALKTDDTNMRKGPGQRYPIEWVYQRRDLPVEVEREYDVWRYVRDADGIEGWVHQVTLSDRRTFLIMDKDAILRADMKDTATAVALLKVGVIGRLRECNQGSQWCEVQVNGYRGYIRRDQLWGLLPDEVLGPS